METVEAWQCTEDCPVRLLDEQSGDRPGMSGGGVHREEYAGGMFGGIDSAATARGDSGGASRFFFTAKPCASEKAFGLEELEAVRVNDGRDTPIDNAYQRGETKRRNKHPTVKSLQLMRHHCRLVTPPGGIVLDPFSGSGSTGVAAVREGFRFIGIEQSEEFASFARARIARWEQVRPDIDDADALKSSAESKAPENQTSLFGYVASK
jgi:site-specific DNA-methyltransferase (adenine-specific)